MSGRVNSPQLPDFTFLTDPQVHFARHYREHVGLAEDLG